MGPHMSEWMGTYFLVPLVFFESHLSISIVNLVVYHIIYSLCAKLIANAN
jgi:hypothetical protein